MTDARLPATWLFRLDWIRLSDRAARTFTASLMWSNEAGTDGKLPSECYPYLHPDGLDIATAEELVDAGWWAVTDPDRYGSVGKGSSGYYVPDWTGTAGQEAAEAVANRRANDRRRKAEQRRRQAAGERDKADDEATTDRDVTADVTADVTRHPVGQDRTGQDSVTEPTLQPTSSQPAQPSNCGECQRRMGMGGKSECPVIARGDVCLHAARNLRSVS